VDGRRSGGGVSLTKRQRKQTVDGLSAASVNMPSWSKGPTGSMLRHVDFTSNSRGGSPLLSFPIQPVVDQLSFPAHYFRFARHRPQSGVSANVKLVHRRSMGDTCVVDFSSLC
jgi:hypothetical protein